MSLSNNQIKWTIFTCLFFLFPAVFFLIFGLYIAPLFPVTVAAIMHTFEGAIVQIAVGGIEFFAILFVFFCYLLWIGIYYYVSKLVSKKITNFDDKLRPILLLVVIFTIVLSGFLPVNTHMAQHSSTAYEVYEIGIRDLKRLSQVD